MRWLCGAVTPWMLGTGLLVSFTATAGYDTSIGSSLIVRSGDRDVPALPPGSRLVEPSFGERRPEAPATLARLPLDLSVPAPEPGLALNLRSDLKLGARVYPLVERGRKGDPLVTLRSSLSRRGEPVRFAPDSLLTRPATVAAALTAGSATWNAAAEPESGFAPWPEDDRTVTDPASTANSPVAAASDPTGSGGTRPAPVSGGTTPAVPKAVALSSTTPAPAEAVPVEIAAAQMSLPRIERDPRAQTTTAARVEPEPSDADRRRYADLITPETGDREQRCLAEAVYFEARGEAEEGQAAVAQVVLNRAKSGLYPANICGVVYQNRHRYMGCQFSFACEGRSLRITDTGAWAIATRVARSVVEGRTYLAEVGGATHYHADYVRPAWSRRLTKMDVVGRHIFYKLKPGQT